jgi:hypothetical protein
MSKPAEKPPVYDATDSGDDLDAMAMANLTIHLRW